MPGSLAPKTAPRGCPRGERRGVRLLPPQPKGSRVSPLPEGHRPPQHLHHRAAKGLIPSLTPPSARTGGKSSASRPVPRLTTRPPAPGRGSDPAPGPHQPLAGAPTLPRAPPPHQPWPGLRPCLGPPHQPWPGLPPPPHGARCSPRRGSGRREGAGGRGDEGRTGPAERSQSASSAPGPISPELSHWPLPSPRLTAEAGEGQWEAGGAGGGAGLGGERASGGRGMEGSRRP